MVDRHDPGGFVRTLGRAEDATASGAWSEAAVHWARVVEANPVEGRYWTRLAEARYQLSDHTSAIDASLRALELRDGFPAETAYRIACCHALLGNADEAMGWLERAWGMGYRHVDRAAVDDDLVSLRDDPRFRELVGSMDTAGLSREEGWRLDLRWLEREVRRRAYAPSREVREEDFDAAVAALRADLGSLSDTQIILRIEQILGLLGDGHARARPPKEREDLQRASPLQFALFEEGLFIVAAAPRHGNLLGSRVVRFGQHHGNEVLAALEPMMVRDNENGQWVKETLPPRLREPRILHALGLIPDPGRLPLTVEGLDGETRTVAVAADAEAPAWKLRDAIPAPDGWLFLPESLPGPLPLYLRNVRAAYWFQHLSDARTTYVQVNGVRNAAGEPLTAFTDRLFDFIETNRVCRLVLDLRWNDGGNTFLALPLLHRIAGTRTINRRGSLFVIIGRRTFSAAQNMASFLDFHTEAIFVGEPTGSSPSFVGETSAWTLPYSRVEVNVSDLRWVGTWPGDYRTWIAPELYTPPTFEAFRTNRDPALDAILALDEHLPGW